MAFNFNKLMQEAKQNRVKIEDKLKPVNNNGQKHNNEPNKRLNVDINSNVTKKPSSKDGPSSDAVKTFLMKQKMREQEEMKTKEAEKRRLLETREKEQKKRPRKDDDQPSTSGTTKIKLKTNSKPEEVWKEGEKRSLERKKAEDLALEIAKQKFKSISQRLTGNELNRNTKSISNEKLKLDDSSTSLYSKMPEVKPKLLSNFKIPSIPKISEKEPVDFTKLMKVASINRDLDPSSSNQIKNNKRKLSDSKHSSSNKKRKTEKTKKDSSSHSSDRDKNDKHRHKPNDKVSSNNKKLEDSRKTPSKSSTSLSNEKSPVSNKPTNKSGQVPDTKKPIPVSTKLTLASVQPAISGSNSKVNPTACRPALSGTNRKVNPSVRPFQSAKTVSALTAKGSPNLKQSIPPKNNLPTRPGIDTKMALPRRPGTPPKSTILPRRPGTPPRSMLPRRPGTPPRSTVPRRPGTPPKYILPRRPGTPPKTVLPRRPISGGVQKRPASSAPPAFVSHARRVDIEKAALLRREMMFKHPERFRPQINNAEDIEDEEEDSDMDGFIDDTEYDDGGNVVEYRNEIRKMFKYNPNRYQFDDDDDPMMETSFGDIQREEARSARLGFLEDLEDIQREQDELKRKSIHKKAAIKKR